jgi:hypothetical protein
MKKTLIALAVLAASGASFAQQVALTGNVTMGYQAATIAGAAGAAGSSDQAGFGTETSGLKFVATEDLGGGYKATAVMNLAVGARAASAGEDATLTLATPVGALVLGTAKAGDYLSGGLAGVGAYYSGMDGKVFSARTSRDTVSFVVPVGSFTLSATYQEAPNLLGYGMGTTGASTETGQGLTGLVASYAAGKLNANLTYLMINSNGAAGNSKDQARLSGNYDFGVVKLGAGAVLATVNGGAGNANPRVSDFLVGLSAPLGQLTIGAQLASRRYDDINVLGGTNGTATGYALEAKYDMSKRTAVIANYARWTQGIASASGSANGLGVAAAQGASSQYQLLLSHSF